MDGNVQGVRRGAGLHSLGGNLFRHADSHRRRSGTTSHRPSRRQDVRSPEALFADQPHVGFWILSNRRVWEGIPANLREIVERNINQEAIRQRAEVEQMNATLQEELQKRGLEFHKVDNAAFRDKLVAAGFYAEWKKRYGDEAWALLESTTGKLG